MDTPEPIAGDPTDPLTASVRLFEYSRAANPVGAGTTRIAMIGMETGAIRFAGEAFSLPWHATVHGAWQSGKDVAGDLAAGLTRTD